MTSSESVWDLYNKFRDVRFSKKVYTAIRTKYERRDRFIQIFMLVAAPSSAVSGWFIWQSPLGKYAWVLTSGLASIAAAVHPLLGMQAKIRASHGLVVQYMEYEEDLDRIIRSVRSTGRYTEKHAAELESCIDRRRCLCDCEAGFSPGKRLRDQCFAQVCQELPPDVFFVPVMAGEDGDSPAEQPEPPREKPEPPRKKPAVPQPVPPLFPPPGEVPGITPPSPWPGKPGKVDTPGPWPRK
ncbi:hypothetical protein [Pseudodesulfovibrio senegalensis]|uniref:SLATT domain-containing protein n=1 Tax=Pseudodesulfovibrio senegalensis TaxID=1721087 RepID=A0A6N6MZF5_9BACT|nr:hypothetical protein [Pseudodesulfovibrio senegalensis]KAB1438979.1 hypothetical protein F8A88_14750 [Pseudodesulfovibrio senegalensis]